MFIYEGKIKLIPKLQEFESGFKKREIIISSDEQYPQDIKFEFLKDDVTILDGFTVGQDVKIQFSLKGNEYKEKYYTNLIGITLVDAGAEIIPKAEGDSDDLPF